MLYSKFPKGSYASLNHRKKVGLLWIIIGLAGVFGIYGLGIYIAGSNKNLLSIVSAISVLPVGNLAATWIARFPYRSMDEDLHMEVSKRVGKMVVSYDLVITSKEKIIPVEAAIIHEREICLYAPDKKVDPKSTEEYIISMIRNNKMNTKIEVIKEPDAFLKRLDELCSLETKGRDSEDLLKKEGVLIAISM